MAFQIGWSNAALADLKSLVRYIARDDRSSAERFGKLIISKIDGMIHFPRIGWIVPEFRDDHLREIVVAPYRIVYEIGDHLNTLTVLRVWHGARGDIELESDTNL